MYSTTTKDKVAPRFELGDNGFAIHGLTTWLCHHVTRSYHILKAKILKTLKNLPRLHIASYTEIEVAEKTDSSP